ncbi:MAG: hypothetical protein J0H07_30225 [Sphingobacteriales bacterium]|nr:hypothetical protein [Sphingobacteriales bacterium]
MERITYTSIPQAEFDRQTSLIGVAFKLIFRAFIFLPLLVTGYAFSRLSFVIHYSILARTAIVFAVAVGMYFLLMMVRGWIIRAREDGNIFWLPVFLLCCAYTCLLTPFLLHEPVLHLFTRWHWPGWLVFAVDTVIIMVTYFQYDFLGWRESE